MYTFVADHSPLLLRIFVKERDGFCATANVSLIIADVDYMQHVYKNNWQLTYSALKHRFAE